MPVTWQVSWAVTDMAWPGAVVIGGDVAFNVVGDVADVVRPHPSTRGGAADAGTIERQ